MDNSKFLFFGLSLFKLFIFCKPNYRAYNYLIVKLVNFSFNFNMASVEFMSNTESSLYELRLP